MSEKSIIEKLGITPGPWENSEGMGYIFANRVGGVQLKAQRMTVANIRGWGCLQYLGEEKARVEQRANENLIATAPELLKDLIEDCLLFERYLGTSPYTTEYIEMIKHRVKTIEKACYPKKWDEIKELL